MRVLLNVFVCGLILAATPQQTGLSILHAEDEPATRRLAFLVGVRQYDNPQLPSLAFPERDVEEFAELLGTSGFQVVLLTASEGQKTPALMPTIDNIKTQLAALLKNVTERDVILVGLAGHGVQMEGSDATYFCPMDADPTIKAGIEKIPSTPERPNTLLSIDWVLKTLHESGIGHKLVLIDACRREMACGDCHGIDRFNASAIPEGIGMLLSCSPGQFAFEHTLWGGGHGAFFYQVIESLKGGSINEFEGCVTWDRLAADVDDRVPRLVTDRFGILLGSQTPRQFKPKQDVILEAPSHRFPKLAVGTKAGQQWSGNALKMRFCWCPPGTFAMGSPRDEPGRYINEDQVEVTLTKGFWLGKFEVTQGQWDRIMGRTLAQMRDAATRNPALVDFGTRPNDPIYWVSHNGATTFCNSLTRQERRAGRLPRDWEYRLPTEAQWEYACRASTTTATAFGDSLSSLAANFRERRPDETEQEEMSYVYMVRRGGTYPSNRWGLCDMHGNVSEWCRDGYREKLPGGIDPEVIIDSAYLVARGGDFRDKWPCRSASRRLGYDFQSAPDIGFRVALVQVTGPVRAEKPEVGRPTVKPAPLRNGE